jgi:pyruvate dehydrogenase E2 component (dihydrolipoamide acetyltransferase)
MMPVPIILPKFGFTLETATIVQWLRHEGDTVRAGDPICEVTTDKVNMEVEAPEAGTLYNLLYEAGTEVPVTQVIAYLLRPGEAHPEGLPDLSMPEPAARPGPDGARGASVTPIARRVAEAQNVDLRGVQGSGPNGRIMRRDVELAGVAEVGKIRATPAARRLAHQHGIDLSAISGSGPRGRVQGTDVQAVVQAQSASAKAVETPHDERQLSAPTQPGDMPKIVKLAGMRRTIAIRLQQSFQTAPHIFLEVQVDASGIETLRERLKARNERLSVTSILIKACAWALLRHPWLNATFDNDEVSLWPTANIGVAVALDEGLVVPVVHHAERLSLHEIQAISDGLAERARNNTLHVNDVMDGTFTISNLGMYGIDRFTAIINPPQVAILAVGRIARQFVPDEQDRPVLRSLMNLMLSADHRVVDGANAANFLADLKAALEEPSLLAW